MMGLAPIPGNPPRLEPTGFSVRKVDGQWFVYDSRGVIQFRSLRRINALDFVKMMTKDTDD